jgi:hypothetical protein
MYKGFNGIDNLNRVMTDIFNPNKKVDGTIGMINTYLIRE